MRFSALVIFAMIAPIIVLIGFYVALNSDPLEVDFPKPSDFPTYEDYLQYDYISPMVEEYDRPVFFDSITYVIQNCPNVELNFSFLKSFDSSVNLDQSSIFYNVVLAFKNVLKVFDFLAQCLVGVVNALIFIVYWLRYIMSGTMSLPLIG